MTKLKQEIVSKQRCFIDIMKSLGYDANPRGQCFGIAAMAMQAFFANDMVTFNKRLQAISNLTENDVQMLKEGRLDNSLVMSDGSHLPFFDLLAFFDGVSLYQEPNKYEKLMGSTTQTSRIAAQYVTPVSLEKDNIALVDTLVGAYDQTQLTDYFNQIQSHLSTPTSLFLTSMSHAISLHYDPKTKHWLYTDANYLPPREIDNAAELAATIICAFDEGLPSTGYTVFSTEVFAQTSNKEAMEKNLSEMRQDEQWSMLQLSILHHNNKILDARGVSLLSMAAKLGDIQLLHDLLSIHNELINMADVLGVTPLYVAASERNTATVGLLLKHGADVNQTGIDGLTPLYTAIRSGQLEIVRQLLAQGAKVNPSKGTPPLMAAAFDGHLEILNELLKHGALVNQLDEDGNTPLFAAAQKGQLNIVKELLTRGALVNQSSKKSGTALMIAAKEGHLGIVNELLKHAADASYSTMSGCTSLHMAAGEGHLDIVIELLRTAVDVNKITDSGETALTWAANGGYIDIVKALLEKDAKVSIKDVILAVKEGHTGMLTILLDSNPNALNAYIVLGLAAMNGRDDTLIKLLERWPTISLEGALYHAATDGRTSTAHLLLAHGAKPNIATNGETPLYIAVKNRHTSTVNLLLECGAEVKESIPNGGSTLRFLAAENGYTTIVTQLLKEQGGVQNIRDQNGQTLLYLAAKNGHLDTVKELLEQKASLSIADNNGETPLLVASQNGHIDIVKELLKQGADANDFSENLITPLLIASQNGHIDIVKELLEYGANPNVVAELGLTPLYQAISKGHHAIVTALLNHEADVNIAYNGITPLLMASQRGDTEAFKALLARGADVNIAYNGITPLFIAAQNGHIDIVKELLAQHADVNQAPSRDKTPLGQAACNMHFSIVTELLSTNTVSGEIFFNALYDYPVAIRKGLEALGPITRHELLKQMYKYELDPHFSFHFADKVTFLGPEITAELNTIMQEEILANSSTSTVSYREKIDQIKNGGKSEDNVANPGLN